MRFCQLRLLAEPQHLLMAIDDGGEHGRTQRRRKYFRRRQVEAHDLRQNLDLYFEGTNRRPAARSAVGLDREESAESKIIDPRIKSDYSAKFLSNCRRCRIVITFSLSKYLSHIVDECPGQDIYLPWYRHHLRW